MSFVSLGLKALENGAKYRVVLKGKQLEGIPELSKLISKIDKPVVHIGVNGRGAEGSIYGVKVFAKGDRTKPVAAFAGRIDYRGTDPMLQARGFVRNNSGGGDAIRANIQMDTSKTFNPELAEELTVSKKKGIISLTAKSDALNADIVADKNGLAELAVLAGKLDDLITGRANMAEYFAKVQKNFANKLNVLNPFYKHQAVVKTAEAVEPTKLKDLDLKFAKDNITKFATEHADKIKVAQKAKSIETLEWMKKDLERIAKTFDTTTDESVKVKLAEEYTKLQHKMSSQLKYIEETFKDV